jgi:hypothetical protein
MENSELRSFLESGLSFMVQVNKRTVFESEATDLQPLVTYIQEFGPDYNNPIIFDKYVGGAAALLMTLIEPQKVYAGVLSQRGKETLERSSIAYETRQIVQYLMDIASEGMCHWERLSLGLTAQEFFARLTGISDRE